MKKILLTTTALTMLAGAATAGVSVTADGRMGVVNSGAVAATLASAGWAAANDAVIAQQVVINNAVSAAAIAAAELAMVPLAAALAAETAAGAGSAAATRVEYRYRVHFNASGETDGGLTFGAKAGLRWDESEAQGTVAYGSSVWMGNGTMTVRVGNTAGAIEAASGIWGSTNVGFSGMSFGGILFMANTSSSTGGTGPNQVALDFSMGSANITVSGAAGANTEIAANFAAGAAKIGIGYDNGTAATGGTTVTVGFDAGSANVNVAYFQPAAGTSSWSLGASMGVGAGTAKAYVANKAGTQNFGVGYNQSLGGGATLGLGYESMGGVASMEAGVSFKF